MYRSESAGQAAISQEASEEKDVQNIVCARRTTVARSAQLNCHVKTMWNGIDVISLGAPAQTQIPCLRTRRAFRGGRIRPVDSNDLWSQAKWPVLWLFFSSVRARNHRTVNRPVSNTCEITRWIQ